MYQYSALPVAHLMDKAAKRITEKFSKVFMVIADCSLVGGGCPKICKYEWRHCGEKRREKKVRQNVRKYINTTKEHSSIMTYRAKQQWVKMKWSSGISSEQWWQEALCSLYTHASTLSHRLQTIKPVDFEPCVSGELCYRKIINVSSQQSDWITASIKLYGSTKWWNFQANFIGIVFISIDLPCCLNWNTGTWKNWL